MVKSRELFDLSHTLAAPLLENKEYPWEVLPDISDFILSLGATLSPEEYDRIGEDVWIAKDAKIYPNNYIQGPCIIGHKSQVRPGAFIRGSALVGDECVVGNSTELKNVILFDHVQVPHYNYVGDSVLGYHAHMGAGAVTSNVKADNKNVVINNGEEQMETGRRKVGAMLGDYADVGCNSVLNPGAVIGRRTTVYPTSCIRGVIPADHIYKDKDHIVKRIEE